MAAVQVIVYAGAIMVLFLFVLMLLGTGNEVPLKETFQGQRPAAVLLTLELVVAIVGALLAGSSTPAGQPGRGQRGQQRRGGRRDPVHPLHLRARDHRDPAGGGGRRRRPGLGKQRTRSGPGAYLLLSAILFAIGVVGVLIGCAIVVFMCIELMLNAVNLSFITFAKTNGALDGQVLAFFVMAVAAAEVVVGLGILVTIFRKRSSISVDDVNLLKG